MGRLDAFSVLSRRRLLKFGLGAGGAVVLGGGGLCTLRGAAPAVDGLRTLSAREDRTLTRSRLMAQGRWRLKF